jgi:DNA polymerase-2
MIEQLNVVRAHHDPDAIIGWSVIQFDLRVLQRTADQCELRATAARPGAQTHRMADPSGSQGQYLFAPMPGPRRRRRHRRAEGCGM